MKLKKVYENKVFIFGGTAILEFEDEENSKQYQLIMTLQFPIPILCLEWVDNGNPRFLDCEDFNLLVTPSRENKWILDTISKHLGVQFTNAIKEIVIDRKEFHKDFLEIVDTLEVRAIDLEYLTAEELKDIIAREKRYE